MTFTAISCILACMKRLISPIAQSFAISLLISVLIPIFLIVLRICDRGTTIQSAHVVYDEGEEMTVQDAWSLFQEGLSKEFGDYHLDLGFFTGSCFVILDSLPPHASEIIDLGPETIDSAKLFAQDENETWQEEDSTGRMVKSEDKKIISWQCSLKMPEPLHTVRQSSNTPPPRMYSTTKQ